jgi:hypothetical protein
MAQQTEQTDESAEIQRFAENAPRWADVSKSIAPLS